MVCKTIIFGIRPLYTSMPAEYSNISIMTLFSYSAFVKPICLPYNDRFDDDYHRDNQGLEVKVAGWGATQKEGNCYLAV